MRHHGQHICTCPHAHYAESTCHQAEHRASLGPEAGARHSAAVVGQSFVVCVQMDWKAWMVGHSLRLGVSNWPIVVLLARIPNSVEISNPGAGLYTLSALLTLDWTWAYCLLEGRVGVRAAAAAASCLAFLLRACVTMQ